MIIQGSDKPILIESDIDLTNVQIIRAALFSRTRLLKEWDENMVQKETNLISLPLTEEETLSFPSGEATIEVKWIGDKYIETPEILVTKIMPRHFKDTMRGEDNEA